MVIRIKIQIYEEGWVMIFKVLLYLSLGLELSLIYSQEPELKSIEEVISIDSLLEEIDRSSENELEQSQPEVNEA